MQMPILEPPFENCCLNPTKETSMRVLTSLATAALVLSAMSCKAVGGDEKSDPANGSGDPHNWAYSLSFSKDNFDIKQGATDTVIVTITRTGGFTGPVTVSAFVPPGGTPPTATIEPITSTGVVTTTRIIITIPSNFSLINGFIIGIASQATNDNVPEVTKDLHMNILRKDGVFVTAPATLSVGQGQSGGLRVSFTRTNFTAPIPMSIALAAGITGITATFDPNPVTDTVTTMTLNVASSVALGTYNVGVRAFEGQTSLQATAPVTLTVTQPGSFTFSLSSNTLFVPRNTTVPIGITINRTNFSAPITFGVDGAPAGLGITISNPALTSSFSIGFSNTGATPAGAYPVTITASAQGVQTQTANLTININ